MKDWGIDKTEIEQLKNICEAYPVWAGDLISKAAKKTLVQKGLIYYRKGRGGSGPDGEVHGGFCPTELGEHTYMAMDRLVLPKPPR
jgi:hypothetical protein